MLTTDRLRLRAFKTTDTESLFDLFTDSLCQPFLSNGYNVPQAPKYTESITQLVNESLFFIIIEELASSTFVGYASLSKPNPKNRDTAFGLGFLPAFWGMGYGKEATKFVVDYAFRELAVHRVSLNVFGGNIKAIKLYEEIGFVHEGRKREANWTDGHWEDNVAMGILEKDWTAQKLKQTSERE